MGRYIENIGDISVISIYRYRYRIGTLDRLSFSRYIDIVSVTSEMSVIFRYFIILFPLFKATLKADNYMNKIEYLIWRCDTSLHLVTSLLYGSPKWKLRNNTTPLTTLLAIMKYMSRPKSAAVKDINIDIADILGHKYLYRIDIGKYDIDPPLISIVC